MKKWKKHGLIFKIPKGIKWIHSRTWVPTIQKLSGPLYKVYFGGLNKTGYTQTGYLIFDIKDKFKILDVSSQPVIKLGDLGSFDDSLALACSFVDKGSEQFLYYVGWMKGNRVRYYPSIGLSISKDNGRSFKKISKAPIINRSDDDPFGMASPFVVKDKSCWKMWYASYRKWEIRNNDPWPTYELRYAESKDGIDWILNGKTCIGSENEEAVARPYVIKTKDGYKMWYTYRKKYQNYRIGYAESNNGIDWHRFDEKVGIGLSDSGWDSEMICYPCVFVHDGTTFMLYNGNGFGQDGIGIATLED